MKKKADKLSYEVVEVPAEEGSLCDLLDVIAELLVGKWMEEKDRQDKNRRRIS